jgi:hypothetical protein
VALKSLNGGHNQIGNWFNKNLSYGDYIFTDSYGGAEAIYSTGFQANTGQIPFHWTNLLRFGQNPKPQIDLIEEAKNNGRDVYYLHLSSKSADGDLVLPFKTMLALANISTFNYRLTLDPLRGFHQNRKFGRQFAATEWDTSYGWIGSEKAYDCCIWRSDFIIYKLEPSSSLTADDFKKVNR